mgnify:CR=1 FL=1
MERHGRESRSGLSKKRSDGLVMEELTEIKALASVIQLAVAPVFLLAGIAGLLNVLSVRLGRAVDRVSRD